MNRRTILAALWVALWFSITPRAGAQCDDWLPLGSGTNGQVSALAAYNNGLIAGGGFTTAGGQTVNYIAQWNGSTWASLGTGMGGAFPSVTALAVYNDELIAAGGFTTAGGVAANRIARWDGSTWSALGAGSG